ncbi:UDP-2,3-diacylglucosamine diphosphatase [Terriglobus aquaticus]|uniref:UDP-2,3-diacylglucosamine diphosphatase n=1 Tax=Terriglobus aquaticus TaxID=940139 RepID=A0ABW9KNT8_9BACT
MSTCDTLILSDLHLGAEVSRAADAMHLIESVDFRQLILLGDIFHDLNFGRLTGAHWKFLSAIRKLSNPKRRRKVIWVEGNHDVGLSQLMSHLVGVPVYQRYVWEYGGKRHLAIHGHQFDRFVNRNVLLSRFFEWFYNNAQKFDSKQKSMSRWLDRLSTRWLRLSDKVAEGALQYAQEGRADRIFCGHTHESRTETRNGVEYFNTGAWMDQNATFIAVDLRGVHLHVYPNRVPGRVADRHPGKERVTLPARSADLVDPAGLPAHPFYESLRC